jgi:Ca2+-binding RTX toxin-like protein
MVSYVTDIDSTQKWITKTPQGADKPILYSFSTSFNTSAFNLAAPSLPVTITANGDSTKWTAAMNVVKDVADITFSVASSASTAQLGLLTGTVGGTYVGAGYRNLSGTNISSGLGVVEAGQTSLTHIHELLHTLGLDHPGHGAGDATAFNAYTVDSTIMRYGSGRDVYVNIQKDVVTPMMYDIALLQQKYGANYYDAGDTGAGTTNTITVNGSSNQARTLWEGGASGYDIINASNALAPLNSNFAHTIDLRGGVDANNIPRFSTVGNEVFSLALDPSTNYTKSIVIEEAIGSRLDRNLIYGNDANNRLEGGVLVDTLEGGFGNDTYVVYQAANGGQTKADFVNDSDGQGGIIINYAGVVGPSPMIGLATILTQTSSYTNWTINGHTVRMVGGNQIAIDSKNGTGSIVYVTDNSFDMSFLGITLDNKTNGTAGADSLGGGKYADSMSGAAGNDTITAYSGNDTIAGGAGNDLLRGNDGNDTYIYNAADGNDTISDGISASDTADVLSIAGYASTAAIYTRVGNTTDLLVSFTSSTDSVLVQKGLADSSTAVETVSFTSGGSKTIAQIRADVLAKQATSGNDTIVGFAGVSNSISGGAGNDSITGDTLADVLNGDAGNDTLKGSSGNDTITGGLGLDSTEGGTGSDMFFFAKGDGTDVMYDRGSSSDVDTLTIMGYASTEAVFNRVGNTDDFTITFTSGTDSLTVQQGLEASGDTLEHVTFASGGSKTAVQLRSELLAKQVTAGNDTVVAFTGIASTISGGAGNDSLTGGILADALNGDVGNDTVIGGYGVDSLNGGLGIDVYTGGSSGDRFSFSKGDTGSGVNADSITDFSRTQADKIALLGYGLSAAGFVGTGAMTAGGAIEFSYTKFATGNYTLIQIDADNNGISDQEIRLNGIQLDMLASDFLFV